MTTGQTWATFPIWDVLLPENHPSVAFEVNLQFESTAMVITMLLPCYNHVHHVLPWKIHPDGSHPKKSKGVLWGVSRPFMEVSKNWGIPSRHHGYFNMFQYSNGPMTGDDDPPIPGLPGSQQILHRRCTGHQTPPRAPGAVAVLRRQRRRADLRS